jgi:hypothetical protein
MQNEPEENDFENGFGGVSRDHKRVSLILRNDESTLA